MTKRGKRKKPRREQTRSGAIERWQDWQAHQYVGGYYTGGRVPPFYRGPRPNRFGWTLVVSGALGVIGTVVAGLTASRPWGLGTALSMAVPGAVAAVMLAAGARLLSKR